MKTITAQDLFDQGYHLCYIPDTDSPRTIGPKMISIYDETHGDKLTREMLIGQFISAYNHNKPIFENELKVNNKTYKTLQPVFDWPMTSLVFAKEI